jgi:CHASE1-domain containing sensor protein
MKQEIGTFGAVLRLAPVSVLSVCLVITALLWNVLHQDAANELQLEFSAEVATIHRRIDERLDDYSNILRGAAGLFAANRSVSRQQFCTYVERLRLAETFPGIQGVGYAMVIPAARKERTIREVREQGFTQFTVWPPGERDVYTAIIYLEPFDWRQPAWPFGKEPSRSTSIS